MDVDKKKKQLELLAGYVTEHKKKLMEEVLSFRTNDITVVLEDIYQSQNASAVIRSCDCFGVQSLHVIENNNEYSLNPRVALGSAKWVSLERYNEPGNNTKACLSDLKKRGYKIVATTPDPSAQSIYDYRLEGKTALLFGTELTGLSDIAMAMADDKIRIPMYGFTESFNISVSAALCLSVFRDKLESSPRNFGLTEEEKMDIKLSWFKKIIKRSDLYLERANLKDDE